MSDRSAPQRILDWWARFSPEQSAVLKAYLFLFIGSTIGMEADSSLSGSIGQRTTSLMVSLPVALRGERWVQRLDRRLLLLAVQALQLSVQPSMPI